MEKNKIVSRRKYIVVTIYNFQKRYSHSPLSSCSTGPESGNKFGIVNLRQWEADYGRNSDQKNEAEKDSDGGHHSAKRSNYNARVSNHKMICIRPVYCTRFFDVEVGHHRILAADISPTALAAAPPAEHTARSSRRGQQASEKPPFVLRQEIKKQRKHQNKAQ